MKKTLLATSAIVGASLLATEYAAAAEAPTHTLSGTIRFRAFVTEQDENAANRNKALDFDVDDAELRYDVQGTADNGLSYGFKIELQANTNNQDNADEARVQLGGAWGTVQLGDEDGAEDVMEYGGQSVAPGTGLYDGDFGGMFNSTLTFGNASIDPGVANDSGDATKISYFTPRISGFQLGVSYTPHTKDSGEGYVRRDQSFQDHVGIGVNYDNTFGDFSVQASALGSLATNDDDADPNKTLVTGDPSPDATVLADARAEKDEASFYAGAALGWKAWSFGINGSARGDGGTKSGSAADNGWNLGGVVNYNFGPGNVGVGVAYAEADGDTRSADDEVLYLGIAGDYTLAEGLKVTADVHSFQATRDNAKDNDATVFVVGTNLNF